MKIKTSIIISISAFLILLFNMTIIKISINKSFAYVDKDALNIKIDNQNYSSKEVEEFENNTTTIPTTSTTKATTTKTSTTAKITTTKKVETTTKKVEISDSDIIFDNLTLTMLTEKLNKHLKSNVLNSGSYFANYTKNTGLDPYLAVSIMLHETGCKWTCSPKVKDCNNVGGIKGKPSCNGGAYKYYETLEDGINGFLNVLYKNYYSKGLTAPELINPKYAESTSWSEKVNVYYETIKNT